MMTREEHILENFDRVINTTKNKAVKQLWTIKKHEYLRQLKWEILYKDVNQPNVLNNQGYIGDEFEAEAD